MRKFINEILRCVGYYIVMVIVTAVMIPAKAQPSMNKISAIAIIAALIINIFRMLLGGDESEFGTRVARHLTTFIFVAYILVFLAALLLDNFSDLLQVITHAFQ